MARSQETYLKKQREKKRSKRKMDKREKSDEKRAREKKGIEISWDLAPVNLTMSKEEKERNILNHNTYQHEHRNS